MFAESVIELWLAGRYKKKKQTKNYVVSGIIII